MNRIPLRVRITLLTVGAVAAVLALLVLSGGISQIEESVAIGSLESSATALTETDTRMTEYVRDLKIRLGEKGEERFGDWGDLPGLRRDFLDSNGAEVGFDPVGTLALTESAVCRASPTEVSCTTDTDGARPPVPEWAAALVTERAERGDEVPIVVNGFVATDETGASTLIRLETDIFAASEGAFITGFDSVVILVLPLLLIGLAAITWFLLGRVLSPVEAMRTQVDRIGAASLDQRVPVPAANDELRHLAETMNRMLDRLQQASESQRRFISDASHELRSPITATGATLELARSDPDRADWSEVAAVIEEENARLAHLVDDLLLLARMDEEASSGRSDRWASAAAEIPVDLDELCLIEAERSHPVEVSVHVASPARVMGDPAALTRAIRNLVDNAAGHATSSVRIEVARSGSDAVVRVVDDGPGIAPEHADRIFERFFRIDESRARAGSGGAGLGLAIARQIVVNHGGTLTLVDTGLEGATFQLRLPLQQDGVG